MAGLGIRFAIASIDQPDCPVAGVSSAATRQRGRRRADRSGCRNAFLTTAGCRAAHRRIGPAAARFGSTSGRPRGPCAGHRGSLRSGVSRRRSCLPRTSGNGPHAARQPYGPQLAAHQNHRTGRAIRTRDRSSNRHVARGNRVAAPTARSPPAAWAAQGILQHRDSPAQASSIGATAGRGEQS